MTILPHLVTAAAAMFIAAVPTGTTADVVITLSDNAADWGCEVYSITGINGTAAATASSSAAAPTATLSCNAGGAMLGMAAASAASSPSASWTGITEDSDFNYGAINQNCSSSASNNFATAQSSLVMTCTFSTTTASAGTFAAFNPA